jgi:hypothetical protein
MGSVYGSSTLNIAAAGTVDGSVRCFFGRYPLASRKFYTMINYPGLSGIIYEYKPSLLYHDCITSTPLGR